jgi:hypothetical protein
MRPVAGDVNSNLHSNPQRAARLYEGIPGLFPPRNGIHLSLMFFLPRQQIQSTYSPITSNEMMRSTNPSRMQ